jgi:predicted transcriptional regulator
MSRISKHRYEEWDKLSEDEKQRLIKGETSAWNTILHFFLRAEEHRLSADKIDFYVEAYEREVKEMIEMGLIARDQDFGYVVTDAGRQWLDRDDIKARDLARYSYSLY